MKREVNSSSGMSVKAPVSASSREENVLPAWGKPDTSRTLSPAPPPVWTRYIDSRLKQFCTR